MFREVLNVEITLKCKLHFKKITTEIKLEKDNFKFNKFKHWRRAFLRRTFKGKVSKTLPVENPFS